MKKHLLLLIIIYILSGIEIQTFAQFYSETIYTTKDGLKSNVIKDLIQTKDGYLWMINAGELCKFDGKDFTYYSLKNDIQAGWENIDLTELTTGEIMLRSTQFVKFNPKTETFIYYGDPPLDAIKATDEDGVTRGSIAPNSATFDKNGNVWYNNSFGVFKLFEDSCINFLEGSNKTIYPIELFVMIDNNGNGWMNTKKALYLLKENGLVKYDLSVLGFDTTTFEPVIKFVTSKGNLIFENGFIAKNNNGILEQKDKHVYLLKNKTLDTLSFLYKKKVTKIIEKHDLIYFLNEGKDILKYNPKEKNVNRYPLNESQGSIDMCGNKLLFYNSTAIIIINNKKRIKIRYDKRNINSVVTDNVGNIWLATERGLIRYSNSNLEFLSTDYTKDNIFKNSDRDIIFNPKKDVLDNYENIWFVTGHDTHNRYGNILASEPKNLYKYNVKTGKVKKILESDANIRNFYPDFNAVLNTFWIQTNKPSIVYLPTKDSIILKNKNEETMDFILDWKNILHNKPINYYNGENLKASDTIIYSYKKLKTIELIAYNVNNKQSLSIVKLDSNEWSWSVRKSLDKGYWVFTAKNQKVYYVSSTLKIKKEKAYLNSSAINGVITIADYSNNVWITSDMGLNFLTIDHDTIKSVLISKKEGLSSTIISDLYIDKNNVLWIATDNGVDKLNVNHFLAKGKANITHFGKKEGLKDLNCTKFIIRNAQLMVFTNSGFAVIDDTRKLTTLDAPQPYFNNLLYLIDGDVFSKKLGGGTNAIEINNPFSPIYIGYNAIKFNNTKPLVYKAVLLKNGTIMDNGRWSEEEEVKFDGLAPGKYNVELYCRVGTKGMKSEPTILEFKILPAWWQTWWFKGIIILAILASLYFLYKWRTIALIKRQKQLEQTVKEKTTEANEERDIAQEQKLIAEEKTTEILDSLNYAKRLQEAILPSPRLVKEWLTESFIFYKPKDIVAGDFYWMESVKPANKNDKQLIFFAAADCTGHGVPGAMVSVVCANALNRAVKEFSLTDSGKILDKVSELVVEAFAKSEDEIKDGMDIALCALDMSNKILYYSGANNPLYRITKRIKKEKLSLKSSFTETHKLIEYKATKRPIGAYIDNSKFDTQKIKLEPGDSIYLFSDGFADQFGGEKGKKLKYSSFRNLLLTNHEMPMEEQKSILSTTFDNWKGALEQIDDVCVIGVKINGIERNNFTKSELKVLSCLQEGLSSKLIADKLNLSKNTIDTYRRRLLAKTGTYNATELINYCIKKEIF